MLCLGTSYDRTRFFLDIPRAAANNKRTRFAYNLIGGKVAGSYNLSSLLGNTVLAVELTYTTDLAKLIFTTNPTGSKVEKTIIYIVNRETSYLLQEDDFLILQEDDFGILLEDSGDVSLTTIQDIVLPKNTFQSVDSDTNFFIVQEDDF